MDQQYSSAALQSYGGYPNDGKYGVICNISAPEKTYCLHKHDYIEIEYIAKGAITHELNGVSSTLRRGDCYGLSIHDMHKFTVKKSVEFHNICINPKSIMPEVRNLLSSQHFPFAAALSERSLAVTDGYFHLLYNELNFPTCFASQRICAYLLLILSEIFSSATPVSENDGYAYRYVRSAVEIIEADCPNIKSLNDISRKIHISPSYLSSLFTKYAGCSFTSYLAMARVEKAKKLLSTTNISVTQAAFECGFGSFSSFTRSFSKYAGISARQFRKLNG